MSDRNVSPQKERDFIAVTVRSLRPYLSREPGWEGGALVRFKDASIGVETLGRLIAARLFEASR